MKIAVDDVNINDTNLLIMMHAPVDIVKLDKSFVDEMLREDWSDKKMASITALIHAKNCAVIAEGGRDRQAGRDSASGRCSNGARLVFFSFLVGLRFHEFFFGPSVLTSWSLTSASSGLGRVEQKFSGFLAQGVQGPRPQYG